MDRTLSRGNSFEFPTCYREGSGEVFTPTGLNFNYLIENCQNNNDVDVNNQNLFRFLTNTTTTTSSSSAAAAAAAAAFPTTFTSSWLNPSAIFLFDGSFEENHEDEIVEFCERYANGDAITEAHEVDNNDENNNEKEEEEEEEEYDEDQLGPLQNFKSPLHNDEEDGNDDDCGSQPTVQEDTGGKKRRRKRTDEPAKSDPIREERVELFDTFFSGFAAAAASSHHQEEEEEDNTKKKKKKNTKPRKTVTTGKVNTKKNDTALLHYNSSGQVCDLAASTMTVQFSINQTIHLEKLAQKKEGIISKDFKNSIAISLSGCSKIKATVFKNGTIKLTGCRDLQQCQDSAQTIIERLQLSLAVDNPGSISMVQNRDGEIYDIHMLKADGMLFPLCLTSAHKILRQDFDEISYEPGKYAGLRVRCDVDTHTKAGAKAPCIILFRTGHVSGVARSLEELNKAYRRVASLLIRSRDELCAEPHKVCDRAQQNMEAGKRKRNEFDVCSVKPTQIRRVVRSRLN